MALQHKNGLSKNLGLNAPNVCALGWLFGSDYSVFFGKEFQDSSFEVGEHMLRTNH